MFDVKLWSRQKKAVALIALLATVIVLLAVGYYWSAISRPLDFGDKAFLIGRGESLSGIASRLVEDDIIKESYTLKLHARLNALGTRIKAGEYKFPEGISLTDFVARIVSGKGQIGIRITFIEGWTFKQMRANMNSARKLKITTLDWSDQQIMATLGKPDTHSEGQFYPDTYYYRSGDDDLSIYKKAFLLMQDKLAAVWENRQPDLQIKDRYEALILASIIEKETWIVDELPLISGVLNNRLREGMRLQTDPTVIYGAGGQYKGRLTRKLLKIDTLYNTYTRDGLPPTPISLPGYESLHAAVNPAKTKAFYFVAMGKGRHKFSKTLKEHNAAVRKYIRGKKNRG